MREFETGATRDSEEGKLDYEGFLSPRVVKRYAEYLHEHRLQADGKMRDSDNWQKGIPMSVYMKSGWRHFMEWWGLYRRVLEGRTVPIKEYEEAICALMFNAMGFLHELLKDSGR